MTLTDGNSVDTREVIRRHQELLCDGNTDGANTLLEVVLEAFSKLRQRNTELELKVSQLLRRHVGRSSEKVNPEQLKLFLSKLQDEMQEKDAQIVVERKPVESKNKNKKHPRRKPLPEDLPRKTIEHDITEEQKQCSICGNEKTFIGTETSKELEFIPAHFMVNEHVRKKYACKVCEQEVTRAKAHVRVIDGSYAGPGLLAHVLVSKYVDHVPLHRLREIYMRSGVELPVSTMSNWTLALGNEFEPIAKAIQNQILNSHLVQVDDTGFKVLQKGKGKGLNVTKGHMWDYVGDRKAVAFIYTPTREGKGPQTFLADYEGYLQADAYAGYDALYDPKRDGKAIEVGCWCHARRYFFDLLELEQDARAAIPIALIRDLYAIEAQATENNMDSQKRLVLRKDRAPPILNKLGKWLAKTINSEPPKSALAKAAMYSVNQWEALNRFLEDGRLPLDNTGAERVLRILALARNNYLFFGSDAGANAAANIYTVFGTCKLCSVDPWTYTQDVIQKLSSGWPARHLDELLPSAWAMKHIDTHSCTEQAA